jgi:hypothetical protein
VRLACEMSTLDHFLGYSGWCISGYQMVTIFQAQCRGCLLNVPQRQLFHRTQLPVSALVARHCQPLHRAGRLQAVHAAGLKSTTTRVAGGLRFRPTAGKAKAPWCFNGCGCYRVPINRLALENVRKPLTNRHKLQILIM